jgi:hypothetical protein
LEFLLIIWQAIFVGQKCVSAAVSRASRLRLSPSSLPPSVRLKYSLTRCFLVVLKWFLVWFSRWLVWLSGISFCVVSAKRHGTIPRLRSLQIVDLEKRLAFLSGHSVLVNTGAFGSKRQLGLVTIGFIYSLSTLVEQHSGFSSGFRLARRWSSSVPSRRFFGNLVRFLVLLTRAERARTIFLKM